MKSQNRYMTLLATVSMLLAGAAYAQSSSGSGSGNAGSSAGSSSSTSGSSSTGSSSTNRSGTATDTSTSQPGSSTSGSGVSGSNATYGSKPATPGASSTMSSSMSATGAGAMSRVSKDSVGNRFTAKDLIGAAVYDPAGERVGDIADIDLHGAVPGSLMMSFNQKNREGTSSSMYPSTGATGSSQTGSSTATSAGSSTSGQSGSLAQTGSTAGAPSTRPSPTDALRDSSRTMMSGIDSALSGASVFVSVGGLWGIGDDLVRVPISMLSYNTSKEHFELSASKAEVVALTETPDRDSGYASMDSTDATAAGKQSFGDEVSRVQSALRTDPQLSGFAHNVMVTSDGDTLELRGTVDTKEQKQQILDAAREATSLKINDDELNVRK